MKALFILVLAFVSHLPAAAQEEAPPPRFIRFLALGERPVWREKIENGVRKQLPNPPGTMPPLVVNYGTEEETSRVNLRLRRMSELAVFPSDAPKVSLNRGAGPGGETFLEFPTPQVPFSIGVTFRDNSDMTWFKPKLVMLADDRSSFGTQQIRLVNTSDQVVIVELPGERPFGIAPGKISMKPIKPGENLLKLGYRNERGGVSGIFQNTVDVGTEQRVQCFFFKAQGKRPRSAVKYVLFAEDLPKAPKIPKPKAP